MIRKLVMLGAAAALAVVTATPAGAVHFYRGPGAGCSPATGEKGDAGAPAAAEVLMLHNTFNDVSNGSPVTVIQAGQSVHWTWNSEHCHSVSATTFESGFHYPSPEPRTPAVLPGLFDRPVPEMETTSLAYTKTFPAPGIFTYRCVHHGDIGMVGTVVVQ